MSAIRKPNFLIYFNSEICCFQEKSKTSLAWAFQKESELLPIFNYYLETLQETGVMDRLRKTFMQFSYGNSDASKIQVLDTNGLGYEHVVLPFLALLTGLCMAFMQLGSETAVTCKKECSGNEEPSNEDDTTSEGGKDVTNM